MNTKIKELNAMLSNVQANECDIETELQLAWNEVFDDMTVLKDAVTQLENSKDYSRDSYGEIVSWIRFDFKDFDDCKEYLKEYMRENHYVDCDFENDSMTYSQGDSLIIQDDTRRDNGVWANHKCVIDENEYKTEENEVDESKRNQLIEAYMEKNGYFPGVFRCDQYGNVFLVNTKE
jgi:hypothetical protein